MQSPNNNNNNKRKSLEALIKRSRQSKKNRQSEITTGAPGEKPLGKWKSNGIHVTHMPDDAQGILRVSLGGGEDTPVPGYYCTFRGDIDECADLLERAAKALRGQTTEGS